MLCGKFVGNENLEIGEEKTQTSISLEFSSFMAACREQKIGF